MNRKRSYFLNNISFRHKLLYYSLLLSIVPILILGAVSSYIASMSMQKEVDRHHQILLQHLQRQIDDFYREADRVSVQLATQESVVQAMRLGPSMAHYEETRAAIDEVARMRASAPFPYDVSLVFTSFDMVYSNLYGLVPLSDFPLSGESGVVDPDPIGSTLLYPERAAERNEIVLVRPVPVFTTPSYGSIVLHVPIDALIRQLEQFQTGSGRELYIVDRHGRVIADNVVDESKRAAFFPPDAFERSAYASADGTAYRLSSLDSELSDWSFVALTPESQLTDKSKRIQIVTAWMALALALVWGLIAFLGSRRLYSPIKRLFQRVSQQTQTQAHEPSSKDLVAVEAYIQRMEKQNKDLQQQWNSNLPHIQENLLLGLLWGVTSEEEFLKHPGAGGLLQRRKYCVGVVEWDDSSSFRRRFGERDRALFMFAFRKIVEELCVEYSTPDIAITIASPNPEQIALIVGTDGEPERVAASFEPLAKQMREIVQKYLKNTITVTFSATRIGIGAIPGLYQEARSLLEFRMLLGPNLTISHRDIERSAPLLERQWIRELKNIATAAALAQTERAREELDAFVEALPARITDVQTARGLLSYFIGELAHQLHEIGADANDIFEENLYQRISRFHTVYEAAAWLREEVFPAIASRLREERDEKSRIDQVLQYIHAHFETDLSLQQLADIARLSPTQLSRMFKEVTGVPYADYLIAYRMEKAKYWLEHSDLPIKTIAERLRYTTVQNFTRIFKQVVGVPPAQYRRTLRGA
ncbi:AraC family transcriptional regulator [Paenibacillus antri]|uniref:AraC family transcriptional regulator n=1 Tax=Paenibacillus antri TaxID=2582848 RepID=A0A5R9G5G5_9BACL|nr:AraC family transcriptional regulator [Paenibacillus antri]TLS51602.1 AraC family transcriptional regulator [Paenibacillus antri]